MISCLIIDDEQHAIDILTEYIRMTPFLDLLHSTTESVEALAYLQKHPVDLIFLDIQMPDLTGIQLFKVLSTLGKAPKVILTTAYSEYALEGYELNVIDYLLKPFPYERFLAASQKALNVFTSSAHVGGTPLGREARDYVLVKTETKGKMLRIELNDIYYIEGLKNYVSIYMGKERVIALLNIKDLEKELPSGKFTRIHKSYIVSVDKISAIDGNQIRLKKAQRDMPPIPIGVTFRTRFFEMMDSKILGGKKRKKNPPNQNS